MTNDQLNRAVAVLRGWTRIDDEVGMPPGVGYGLLWPDYCTDPAAWGGLFVELAGEGLAPLIDYGSIRRHGYVAAIDSRTFSAFDPALPGRALALAYVAAMEGTKE